MSNGRQFTLNAPVAVTLSPQALKAIIEALSEKPYIQVAGVLEEIFSQLRSVPPASLAPAPVGPGPAA